MIKKVAESKALKLAFGISNIQIEDDFNIQNGVALPSKEEKKKKRELSKGQFEKFIKQTDDYIEKYKDKIVFTDEQQQKLKRRLI